MFEYSWNYLLIRYLLITHYHYLYHWRHYDWHRHKVKWLTQFIPGIYRHFIIFCRFKSANVRHKIRERNTSEASRLMEMSRNRTARFYSLFSVSQRRAKNLRSRHESSDAIRCVETSCSSVAMMHIIVTCWLYDV